MPRNVMAAKKMRTTTTNYDGVMVVAKIPQRGVEYAEHRDKVMTRAKPYSNPSPVGPVNVRM